jgi:hypothetical protein
MEQLNFHESGATRKKDSSTKCDFWIRMSTNKKSGIGVFYAALTQHFVDRHLFSLTEKSTTDKPTIDIAIDIKNRVLVAGVTDAHVRPSARKRFKARNGTAYYLTSKPLVVEMVEEFKVDTSKDNHYFRLMPDGEYYGRPRFKIIDISNT